jgi:flavin reductase (DIM6/NTAB) family NADH-FMN oxidoreductase RutF
MELAVRHRFAAGDHDILVGEMISARISDGEPLIYFGSRYRGLTR